MNVFGEPMAELDQSATLCLHLLRGGMKCEYSFVSGGNTSWHRIALGVTVLTRVVAIVTGRSHKRRDDDKFCVPNKPVENHLGSVCSSC